MFLSLITKNLKWEILTKNLVTFKRWDEVKDKKFYYYGGSLKNPNFSGGHEKPIYRGDCLKRGALGQFADIKGGLVKKRGWCYWGGGGGGLIPQCTLWLLTMLCCLLSSSGIRKLW